MFKCDQTVVFAFKEMGIIAWDFAENDLNMVYKRSPLGYSKFYSDI